METFQLFSVYFFNLALIGAALYLFGLSFGFALFSYSPNYWFALRGVAMFAAVVFAGLAAYDYFFSIYSRANGLYSSIIFTVAFALLSVLTQSAIPAGSKIKTSH